MKTNYNPTEMDWARLAAYIDGEGHIRICVSPAKHVGFLAIIVSNTDPRLSDWIVSRFGGWVSVQRKMKHPTKWKQCFRWNQTCKQAADLLERCRPYLLLKADQADLAIAFQRTVFRVGVKGHSSETVAKRMQLRDQLQALTKRGPKAQEAVN